MNIDGLIPANPRNRNIANATGSWSGFGSWNPNTSYSVPAYGGRLRANFTNCPGTKTRIEIDFKLDTLDVGFDVYLLTSDTLPADVPTQAIASATAVLTTDLQTIVFDNVSIPGDSYYVCFINTGSLNRGLVIKAARAVTSYTVSPELAGVYGPSGNVNTYSSRNFRADIRPSVGGYNPFTFSSASLHWRNGTTGPYETVLMTLEYSDTRATATVPGYTFSVGTVEWYITATANTGETLESTPATFESLNYYLEATPISPNNSLAGNNTPITFEWELRTYDSESIGQTDLQYRTDESPWTDFASVPFVDYESRFYTAPANTFPGGSIYWRARAIGAHGAVGIWSDAISFQAFGAPVVSDVSATEVPFSTVSWNVAGQLAYEIQIDDKRYGPYFGSNVRRYVLPEPLADELHTVRVRAQNKYGLWSEWAETTVFIRNIPSPLEITLTGFEMFGATLLIQKPLYQGTFYIYRDGKLIGKTTQSQYYDIRAVGTHQYYVLDVTQSGYYTKSNTVELDCPVKEPWMCLLPEGPTLPLTLSENAKRSQTITRGREVAYTQYAGAKYPETEVGEHESLTVTGDVSFTQAQQDKADTFESFLGKRVVYKTPGGLCVAGVLEGFQRRDPKHYKSYTFSITQMEWEDYYDADSGILL